MRTVHTHCMSHPWSINTIYRLVHTWVFPVHTMPSENVALLPTGRLLAVTIVGVTKPRACI